MNVIAIGVVASTTTITEYPGMMVFFGIIVGIILSVLLRIGHGND
jgi:uncharacterized membrane protein